MLPIRPRDAAQPREERRRDASGKRLSGRPSAAQTSLPSRIAGAQWQAGVTRDNDRYRITLNGLVMPMAFAAHAGEAGWVMVYVDPEPRTRAGQPVEYAGLNVARTGVPDPITGNDAAYKKLEGHVRILPGDSGSW